MSTIYNIYIEYTIYLDVLNLKTKTG